jgi:hypothetical protein
MPAVPPGFAKSSPTFLPQIGGVLLLIGQPVPFLGHLE